MPFCFQSYMSIVVSTVFHDWIYRGDVSLDHMLREIWNSMTSSTFSVTADRERQTDNKRPLNLPSWLTFTNIAPLGPHFWASPEYSARYTCLLAIFPAFLCSFFNHVYLNFWWPCLNGNLNRWCLVVSVLCIRVYEIITCSGCTAMGGSRPRSQNKV